MSGEGHEPGKSRAILKRGSRHLRFAEREVQWNDIVFSRCPAKKTIFSLKEVYIFKYNDGRKRPYEVIIVVIVK